MNSVQIEENVKSLVKQVSSQEISKDDFVYELLLAYGHRKSVVSRVKSGERNLAKTAGEVILKRHLYFKPCTSNLFAEIDALKNSKTVATNKIRFVVVTDFSQLIAIDTKTQDTLDIELGQLAKHFDFFLPWAGMEKMVYRGENPADVKAAEKMADFFDHIKATNYPVNATKEQLHEVVVFLNRLLFCFFAEDTKIFSENQFTNLLNQHTQEDGSDLVGVFERLFEVLNTPAHQRNDLPKYLNNFPYVNGGLFKKQIKVPTFDAKARRMLLDSGSLDWSDINPDIFGSMIQGVADPETRSKMGMHYTSVSNIMKVIEPLFLNDLYEEFDKCNDNINKLKKLQVRLSRIKFFDPACGSGNFLIITYKEIRLLEIEILKRISELEKQLTNSSIGQNYTVDVFGESLSSIRLEQFYGIELDDFAHEMAILSLWLVEHQMNMVFETEFGYTAPTLPLKQSGRIVAGNALEVNWSHVCPCNDLDEVYVIGNPPYLGARFQSKEQKESVRNVFPHLKEVNSLDYISCWFYLASKFINDNSSYAFVTTNSLVQGQHVSSLWPTLLSNNVKINFGVTAFKWKNNAKDKAGVTCVIIGLSKKEKSNKLLYSNDTVKSVKNISPYLTDGSNVVVEKLSKPLANIPKLVFGNQAIDGGHLILTDEEKNIIVSDFPEANKYIRPLLGAEDFLKGRNRWVIWVKSEDLENIKHISHFNHRFESVMKYREMSGQVARSLVDIPYRFRYVHESKESTLLLPRTTSENREYLPIGFVESKTVVTDAAQVIYDPEPYIFGILSSKLHLQWVKAVAGGLETRIRYSNTICYNTFPIPELDQPNKDIILELSYNVLEAREAHSTMTIEKLYNPETMPKNLREAHEQLDKFIDSLYGIKPTMSDGDRLKTLFDMYLQQVGGC
ncbi:class I SAM-dependent DNA methyltransferase [Vibrio parahaemolyticus]